MGIKKLNKFLTKNNCINYYDSLDDILDVIDHNNKFSKNKIFAIDTSLYMYKYTYSYKNYLVGFLNQISKLLSHNIIPVYVFEGTPPVEKNDVIQMRYEKRNKLKERIALLEEKLDKESNFDLKNQIESEIKRLSRQIIQIKKNMVESLKEMLDILNIKYINSNGESDSMCSYLYKNNYVDAVISDDMDILVSGVQYMIKFEYKRIVLYDLKLILKNLNLTYERFVEMCVIFGCDYVKPIPKLNNERIYDLIKTELNLEQIISVINNTHINTKVQTLIESNKDLDQSIIDNLYRNQMDYISAKNIFINSSDEESVDEFKIDTFKNKIILDDLEEFIDANIDNIKKYIFQNIMNISYKINQNLKKNSFNN